MSSCSWDSCLSSWRGHVHTRGPGPVPRGPFVGLALVLRSPDVSQLPSLAFLRALTTQWAMGGDGESTLLPCASGQGGFNGRCSPGAEAGGQDAGGAGLAPLRPLLAV